MIPAVTPYSTYNRTKSSNPSFSAIHRMHYYVRWSDDHYYRAPEEVVKDLQKYIVTLLNKDYNAMQRGATNQSNTTANAVKDSLVSYFKREDSDYVIYKKNGVGYGMVCSFYPKKMPDGYGACILTGNDMQRAKNQGRGIGQVYKRAKTSAQEMSREHDISYEKAREELKSSYKSELSTAKEDYYKQTERMIRETLLKKRQKDSDVKIFFEPAIEEDGKCVYKLADVEFVSRV